MRLLSLQRSALPAISRVLAALAIAVLGACVAGCLTAEGTLERDGTGRLTLTYELPQGSTEASQRLLLKAPGVSVESFSIGADRTASARLKVTDLAGVGKTNTVLRHTTVTKAAHGDYEVLTIRTTNHAGRLAGDERLPGPTIRITLPGQVVEANEAAIVRGATVEWTFSLGDWLSRTTWELTARYRVTNGGPTPDDDRS